MDDHMDIDEGNGASTASSLPQSLVAGREKRSTAGNRLQALLDQAETDDIDLLFDEPEDDVEFEGQDEEDVDLGSSEDEDGGHDDDDELAGEKQLEKDARAASKSKAKKRKDGFPGQQQLQKLMNKSDGRSTRQKKVTIQDPTDEEVNDVEEEKIRGMGQLDDSLRKKSERISWLPKQADLPARQSSRKQTVANHKATHQKLKEAEERRIKTISAMNEALLRKKGKAQQVVWTQEMRLEEAKKTEAKNLKSLNKWQENEAIREEARRAKLAALHNRRLEGPVITIISRRGAGIEPLIQPLEDKEERRGRPKGSKKEGPKVDDVVPELQTNVPSRPNSKDGAMAPSAPAEQPVVSTTVEAPAVVPDVPMPDVAPVAVTQEAGPSDEMEQCANTTQTVATSPQQTASDIPIFVDARDRVDSVEDSSPRAKTPEYSTRTFVALKNFGGEGSEEDEFISGHVANRALFPDNKGPLPKPVRRECVVSNVPARFLDPATGLAYADITAYKQIQRVRSGHVTWSDALQCFVGKPGEAAVGVPEGFLN